MKKLNSIEKVRQQIDLIDSDILDLIVKRHALVIEAVKLKRRDQIIDKTRIKKIIRSLKEVAKKKGLPPYLVETVWMEMINGFIKFEEESFDEIHNNKN
tara:strand:- start:620 stop:916 length:297 start_codon:yes stop_codon:yes gene_type:complete